jgi:hypothetical protein
LLKASNFCAENTGFITSKRFLEIQIAQSFFHVITNNIYGFSSR